ncbi:acetyl-CoA C-acyltransferase [Saccharopolyspora pogona]|uniref:acetyl-CoA C-acyltransferase n=1 Tax=Saccharopolyspora pogona TaxID=333966 RepID=UPI001684F9A5|nr:acetyl-CoA C-acyltransferase [Saccharopolyspora pogona]
MVEAVVVAGARTPIGRLLGALAEHTAPALGGIAIQEAVARAGLSGANVDAVIMGTVVQAGVGPNPARLAAARAGIPMTVPATTVNKLCLSGLAAIAQAAQLIAVGQYETVVAGGLESMTSAPHVLAGARRGFRYGGTGLADALDVDALTCAFDGVSMGAATERYQATMRISRAEQDAFAAESHTRAAAATKEGRLAEEIVPVTVSSKGSETVVDQDEGIRPETTAAHLSRLRPAFAQDGTITAGSSSQLSDGACAVVVMSKDRAQALGLPWLAEIGAYGTVAGPDPSLLRQPANAIRDALRRDGSLTVADLDLLEINEAFAGVAITSMRELAVSADQVNVNGGAIALGHPVGMSGARLVLSLALELRRRGGGVGAAALCGGGGQGDALIIRTGRLGA